MKSPILINGDNYDVIDKPGGNDSEVEPSHPSIIKIHIDDFDSKAIDKDQVVSPDYYRHVYLSTMLEYCASCIYYYKDSLDLVQYDYISGALFMFDKKFQIISSKSPLSDYDFYYDGENITVVDVKTGNHVQIINDMHQYRMCFNPYIVIRTIGFSRLPLIGFTITLEDSIP